MKCYTYNPKAKSNFDTGIDFSKYKNNVEGVTGVEKTIAFRLLTSPNCDTDKLIADVGSRENREIYLCCPIIFIKGDSVSKTIPEDCFLLEVPTIDFKTSPADKSLPLLTTVDTVLRLCYKDECYIKLPNGKYIHNIDGKPCVKDSCPSVNINTDAYITIEF